MTRLTKQYGVIFIIGFQAFSVIHVNEGYYLFDSHSRDRCGNPVADGFSVLLSFTNALCLDAYLRQQAANLNQTLFEVTFFKVQKVTLRAVKEGLRKQSIQEANSSSHNLHSKDVKLKHHSTSTCSSNNHANLSTTNSDELLEKYFVHHFQQEKSHYNKLYKQSQRKLECFHQTERRSEKRAKKKTRLNNIKLEQSRKIDKRSKQKARQNEDKCQQTRKVEQLSKAKARKDDSKCQQTRKIEQLSKAKSRKDDSKHQQTQKLEQLSKAKARKD
jgi:hypothetical protein